MKKIICESILISLVLSASFSQVVKAETNGMTGDTDVFVNVTADTNPMQVVMPNDPNKAATGNHKNGAHPSGPLSLVYVTPSIQFGGLTTNPIGDKSNQTKVDIGKSLDLWDSKFVAEVGDERGTKEGWNLTVTGQKLTQIPKEATDGKELSKEVTDVKTLDGATLDLPMGKVQRSNQITPDVSPSAQVIQLDGSTGPAILIAKQGNGAGMTTYQIEPTQMILTVPTSKIMIGDFATKLTWTLQTGPKS